MNSYQIAKARKIADILIAALPQSSLVTRNELARTVARLSNDDWRTISFAAGVPVADIKARQAVLAILRKRSLHAA